MPKIVFKKIDKPLLMTIKNNLDNYFRANKISMIARMDANKNSIILDKLTDDQLYSILKIVDKVLEDSKELRKNLKYEIAA